MISVGNLSTGGTGKTPMVEHLAKMIQDSGGRPLIAMRGYRAKQGEPADEQAEYAERLPGITVLADPKRFETVQTYLSSNANAVDCLLLDDGFQHRQLARDLDLVLLDATRPFWRDHLLPLGMLRERKESLARADAVIITRCDRLDATTQGEIRKQVLLCHQRPPVAWTRYRWAKLHLTSQERNEEQPAQWLAGKPVCSVVAIGNPDAFEAQLRGSDARVVCSVRKRDHYHYDARFVQRILRRTKAVGAEALVTTSKDWVKLIRFSPAGGWPLPVVRPIPEVEFLEGEEDLRDLVSGVLQAAT